MRRIEQAASGANALDEFGSESSGKTLSFLQAVPAYSPGGPSVRLAPPHSGSVVWRGLRALAWAPLALIAFVVLQVYWFVWVPGPGARSFGAGVRVRIRIASTPREAR
jgi:hypothetical protein